MYQKKITVDRLISNTVDFRAKDKGGVFNSNSD